VVGERHVERFVKVLSPPPLPAGESALLVDDSELIEDDAPATPDAPRVAAEPRVTGLTAQRPGRRELDVAFLSEVYLFGDFDLDIAKGGVFLPTYAAFEPGERVELCFEFGARLVRVVAEVRWQLGDGKTPARRPGFALFWSELEPEALNALERHCAVYPPRFYEL
jgi:hypothetical protein